ncbi:MAG TPA: signal peptidase II [Candidatus Nanoarchaeia archaeon]|nr:signal peptidase II [Candidatus Nanoarchaeia archaeon]
MKKYIFLSVMLLLLDQGSKWFFQERTVAISFLSLHPVTNTGALFGLFQGWNTLFLVISFLVLGFVWMSLRDKPIVFSLFNAGIVGNMIDRIVFGHVRDFIDVGFWPVFNLADSYLTIGVLLLLLSFVRKEVGKKHIPSRRTHF